MRAVIHSGLRGGVLAAPPSKSMAHRALLCAALAAGESRVTGIAPSEDMRATLRAMECLGATITYDEAAQCASVCGAPLSPANAARRAQAGGGTGTPPLFAPVCAPVDCGESGSTLRFVIPLFSLTGAPVTLTGRGRLPGRPQGVYADLFAARGLRFAQTAQGIALHGALTAGEYTLDGSVSSQFISGLLFALPLVPGNSILRIVPPFESRSYVDLTLQVMADFGVRAAWLDETTLAVQGGQTYRPCCYSVEGDCSQAAFFAVLAACLPQCPAPATHMGEHGGGAHFPQSAAGQPGGAGGITLANLRADTRQGDRVVFDILRRCGARVLQGADGSVTVLPSRAALRGAEIDLADCPDLGPILMVLGLFCAGETVLRNAGRLRVKESDRIAAMETEIRKLGGEIGSDGDTVWVRGAAWEPDAAYGAGRTDACGAAQPTEAGSGHTPHTAAAGPTRPGFAQGMPRALHPSAALCGQDDHRIVMSMAVVAAAAGFAAACEIDGAEAVNKSYPAFFADLAALGARVETV